MQMELMAPTAVRIGSKPEYREAYCFESGRVLVLRWAFFWGLERHDGNFKSVLRGWSPAKAPGPPQQFMRLLPHPPSSGHRPQNFRSTIVAWITIAVAIVSITGTSGWFGSIYLATTYWADNMVVGFYQMLRVTYSIVSRHRVRPGP